MREQLAAVLAGPDLAPGWDHDPGAWLDCARDEGVTALLAARLEDVPEAPEVLRAACREQARGLAAAELRARVTLRQVLTTLDRAGIAVLVLKGAALAQWLYPDPYLRESSDIDLLFASREDAERAAAALAPTGYTTPYRPTRFQHELLCRSLGNGVDLDLHWLLSDWPALSHLPVFATLLEASIALPGLGPTARGLDAPHALLHACIHRASNLSANLGDRLKWLYDLHLLAGTLDGAEWERFVHDCRQARACGICVEGLMASKVLFGTSIPAGVAQALEEGRVSEPLDASRVTDWHYVQRRNFQALPGWSDKAAWLWSRLLPPAGHMRELYGEEHGQLALLWLRVRRAVARLTGRG